MFYFYLKAIHIIFIVTWFAGLFYMPRFFIYSTEANDKADPEKSILQKQFLIMMRRLWFGITWPSAILTLVLGPWVMIKGGWDKIFLQPAGNWLLIKSIFVLFLYVYHFTLHAIYKQESKGIFKYSSQQLRLWNEVATVFLVAIVMIAVVKQNISIVWGIVGLIAFIVLLFTAIKIYKLLRKN